MRVRAAPACAHFALVGGVHGRHAEACRQDAIEGGRGAAALDVAEHRRARLVAGARLDLPLEALADSAEAHVAELVLGVTVSIEPSCGRAPPPPRRSRRSARASAGAESGGIPRRCRTGARDQDHAGAAGDPEVERDPAGVAAHPLDDHHAVV